MDKIKKTNQEIIVFVQLAGRWLAQNKAETKFSYAMRKMHKRLSNVVSEYNEKISDLNAEHAATDDNEVLLRDGNDYRYTKDGVKKRDAERLKLFKTEVEFEPYYAPRAPEGLSSYEREIFEGFVLAPSDEPETEV